MLKITESLKATALVNLPRKEYWRGKVDILDKSLHMCDFFHVELPFWN